MGKKYDSLSDKHQSFIKEQKIFFVGTADRFGRVNVSPKGLDSFRILGPNSVLWLNHTGSGNETAPHVFNHDRMTIMFCSFDKKPMILRMYGTAKAFHGKEPEWNEYISMFSPNPGFRQLFLMSIDLVQTSCGFGVPLYDFVGERTTLLDWANQKGEDGIREYWKEKNGLSIDGVGTRIQYLKDLK